MQSESIAGGSQQDIFSHIQYALESQSSRSDRFESGQQLRTASSAFEDRAANLPSASKHKPHDSPIKVQTIHAKQKLREKFGFLLAVALQLYS